MDIPNNVYMLDIETYGITPGCAIGSIGCVRLRDGAVFYVRLDLAKQPNGKNDEATITWWNTQPSELWYEAMGGTEDNEKALRALRSFLEKTGENPIMWCKGTDFDLPILSDLYTRMKMYTPWKYHAARDFRTVKKIFNWGSKPRNLTELHNAMHDAQFQADELIGIAAAYNIKLD